MVGKTVLHYKILEQIGQGGMGVVYRAEDTKLKREVALKFLLPHILSSEEEKARFIHEAQAAASLHHPSICTIHEINEAEGQTFIAMAYLEGEALNERIARGPIKPVEALRITLQVARGLKVAHENGVVHRDIKSSNIMISQDGRATIMDFGLAKSVRQTHATQKNTKMGTIGYMSPEQSRGDPVDHRTDIWSLGVLLYEMIAGQRPFRGDYDEAVIYSILNEEPEPLLVYAPDAPQELWLAVQRAIAKKPDARYQTAAELVEDLEVLYEDVKTGSSSRRRVGRTSGIYQNAEPVSKRLFSARVFVTLLVYLIFAAAAFLFSRWVVGRYAFDPRTANIVLVAVLSLVPTVWILAARKGAYARPWPAITKIGIPANIVVSAVLIAALFAGRDLDAATETVTVLDETGRPIERAIPKSEYRKSLMLYFLDNETGDRRQRWVGGAIMLLLQVDLFQDQFLHLQSCIEPAAVRRLQESGFSTWFDAPWSFKREYAEKAHIDYVVTGSYKLEGSDWAVKLRLHESQSGRLVASYDYAGENLFALVDEASLELRRDVGLPERHIEQTQDLPIAEMLTASMSALEDFCIGVYVALFEGDWAGGVEYLERSVAADSTFSWGNLVLYQLYHANNVPGKSDRAMRAAMQHIYKLPERMQFLLKTEYYQHVQDPDKVLGVAQMMVELYPDAIESRAVLAAVRLRRNERALAIEQYEKVLEIDPSRTEFLQAIADLYRQMGDYDRAVASHESYIKRHPADAGAYSALGAVYESQGKYDEAKKYYEKSLVIDPSQVRVLVDLGDIEAKLDNDQTALDKWDDALERAKTPEERARIRLSMRNYYSSRGQMEKSLEQLRLYWDEQAKFLAPVEVLSEKLDDLCFFVWAGRTEEAFDIIEEAEAQLVPPYDVYLLYGRICVYVELKDPDKTEESLEKLWTYIDTQQMGHLRGEAYWTEGEMEEARGRYEAAIGSYEKKLREDPADVLMYRSIGRCQRKLGRYADAIASIGKMLRIYPNNAQANYELALAYRGAGDQVKAMEHLNKALSRWANADPVYELARKARATLEEWTP